MAAESFPPERSTGHGPATSSARGSDVSFDPELIRGYGAIVHSVEPLNALRWQAEPEAAADPRLTVLDAAVAPQDMSGQPVREPSTP
jgi:hypothetical protein